MAEEHAQQQRQSELQALQHYQSQEKHRQQQLRQQQFQHQQQMHLSQIPYSSSHHLQMQHHQQHQVAQQHGHRPQHIPRPTYASQQAATAFGPDGTAIAPSVTAEVSQKGTWDNVEDNILRAAVASYNGKNWAEIAKHLPGRSPVQCLSHWKNVLNSKVVKGKGSWTPDEDEKLKQVVETFGAKNWAAVIAPHLPNRMGKQCRERWYNHLNPDLKKTPWTDEEEQIAAAAHSELGNKWADIAKRLPGRSDNDVKNHWYASLRRRKTRMSQVTGAYSKEFEQVENPELPVAKRPKLSPMVPPELQQQQLQQQQNRDERYLGRWSANEGATLLSLVDKFGAKNWAFIAAHLPGRSDIQCLQHWRHVLNPNVVKGRGSWTAEEDAKLKQLVEKYGPKKWASAIAMHLPGRMGKQCRERWHNKLNPKLSKEPWKDEEEKILAEKHKELGNRWALIAKALPGRSDNDVKNHFYASLRRKSTKRTGNTSQPPAVVQPPTIPEQNGTSEMTL